MVLTMKINPSDFSRGEQRSSSSRETIIENQRHTHAGRPPQSRLDTFEYASSPYPWYHRAGGRCPFDGHTDDSCGKVLYHRKTPAELMSTSHRQCQRSLNALEDTADVVHVRAPSTTSFLMSPAFGEKIHEKRKLIRRKTRLLSSSRLTLLGSSLRD